MRLESPPGRGSRPDANGAATKVQVGRPSHSLDGSTDTERLARRHDYALYVLAERADGRLMGQVFTSLPAAERKVTRTRDRGLHASMTLVRLVPVRAAIEDAQFLLTEEGQ